MPEIFKGDYSDLKNFKKRNGTAGSSFKNCTQWMQTYKEWESNLDKCLPLSSEAATGSVL